VRHPWIHEVTQAVAQEIHAEDDQHEHKAGKRRHPRSGGQKGLALSQHVPPTDRRGLSAETKKREPGLSHDVSADAERGRNQEGPGTVSEE